jgi:hypothetical protein
MAQPSIEGVPREYASYSDCTPTRSLITAYVYINDHLDECIVLVLYGAF